MGLTHQPPSSAAVPALSVGDVTPPALLLRQALAAIERDDDARAEELLETAGRQHPIVADYADLQRMRLLVDAARYGEAIALRRRWAGNGSPIRADLLATLGEAHAAAGDAESARAAWHTALDSTDESERRAQLYLDLGHSYESSGQTDAAARSFAKVWTGRRDA